MTTLPNTYFFDGPTAAEQAAKFSNDDPAAPYCYYDGPALPHAPDHCVNVPIDTFYAFFMTSPHGYPAQLNFDNKAFSDEVKGQITEGITATLQTIQKERTAIVNKLIGQAPTLQNLDAIVYTLLGYLTCNGLINEHLPLPIVKKLLLLTHDAPEGTPAHALIKEETRDLIAQVKAALESSFAEALFSHIRALHLWFALESLGHAQADQSFHARYFHALAVDIDDIATMQEEFALIKCAFPDDQLGYYLERFAAALFTEQFWTLPPLRRKHDIFKYYYFTNQFYHRGEQYGTMFKPLLALFNEAMKRGDDEVVMYLHTPLLFTWNGIATVQEEFARFNAEVEQPLEAYLKSTLLPKYDLPAAKSTIDPSKPVHIAFLQERLFSYSIYKVFFSLIKALMENSDGRYRITVYDLNFLEFGGSNPATVNELKALGVEYVDLHSTLVGTTHPFYSLVDKSIKTRQRLIDDGADILIGIFSRPEYNFLFTSRTAPAQLYWSHGNYTVDIGGIDYRIKHGDRRAATEEHCGHTFLQFPDLLQPEDLNPEVSADEIREERKKYPEGAILLGTMGRLSKIDEGYIAAIAEIMQRHPNTVYLACGSGDSGPIKEKLIPHGIAERWFFPGHVNQHLYGHLIDIWPNTFPHSQGLSTLEFMAKGKIAVQMITVHFSNLDMVENGAERLFQAEGCDVERWLEHSDAPAEVRRYLEANFFEPGDNEVRDLMVPALLYAPTASPDSYRAKLDYYIRNLEALREPAARFATTLTRNRWLSEEAAVERFTQILDTVVKEQQ